MDRDSGWHSERWKYSTKQKEETEVQNGQKLVTQDIDSPKQQNSWANSLLAELAGSEGGKRKHLLTPESRDTGRCNITRYFQKQISIVTNMFRQKMYGLKFLLPKTDGILFLFFSFLSSSLPSFLFSFGWLFNKSSIKSTALKIYLYDKCL